MELFTGGSLFNILDDPINYYGLEEREFLLVLKHLGMNAKMSAICGKHAKTNCDHSRRYETLEGHEYNSSRFKARKYNEIRC